MSKKKKEKIEKTPEQIAVEQEDKKKKAMKKLRSNKNRPWNLDDYIEENDKSATVNAGFRVFIKGSKKELRRMPKEEWDKLMERFLNKPIKN